MSDYLNSMVRAGMLRQDMAEELNTLPTKEQQRQAYRRLPEACCWKPPGESCRTSRLENNPPAKDNSPAVTTLDAGRTAEPVPASLTLGQKIGAILLGLAITAGIFHENLLQIYYRLKGPSRGDTAAVAHSRGGAGCSDSSAHRCRYAFRP